MQRSALMLAGHPPGAASGSSARGAVTLAALRSSCERVDALALALPGEERFADASVTIVERTADSSAVERLGALARGGSFYLPERRADLGGRVRSLVATGALQARYDVVWAHSSLMARVGAEAFGARARVLDIDNVAGAEMRRHAEGAATLSPRRLYRQLNGLATTREERRRARAYDHVVVTSLEERERLGVGGMPVTVVPNTLASASEPVDPSSAPAAMLFVGSLDYEPNLDALRFLFDDLLPRVRAALPDVGVTVAGRNPVAEVERLCAAGGATLVANAPSLDALYRDARVVLAPLRMGGGTRYKLIEAMAHGGAIVATPQAVEGLGLEDDRDARIAASPDEFARACAELLDDPGAAGRLGSAARERWRRCHHPDVAKRAVADLLDELAPTRAPAAA